MVRDFVGHGVGRVDHEPPDVLRDGAAGEGCELRPDMIFTIEPMINIGRTAVTRDRSLSAQFELSIGITETGCEIFTASPRGFDRPSCAGA